MIRVLLISPIFAALAFTATEALQLMYRSDIIYIPVVFELMLLGVSYTFFAAINAIIIVPIFIMLTYYLTNYIAGFFLSFITAVLISYAVFATKLFGPRRAMTDHFFLFGLFLPLLLTTCASFYFTVIYRKDRKKDKTRQIEIL